jgi:hypothetical protein
MLFILLLTDWFSRAYDTFIWPFLGFLFMPYSTLAYMAGMINNDHSINGWWLVLVVIGVLFDLGCWGNSASSSTSRKG